MKLLEILKKMFSSRRHHRFPVDEGVLVVIEPYAGQQVQVLDISALRQVQMMNISEGGCAFIYQGSRKDLEESGFLSLKFKDIPYLERVGIVTKSDCLLCDLNDKEGQLRIKRVEFQWEGVFDQEKLKEFIKQNAIAGK